MTSRHRRLVGFCFAIALSVAACGASGESSATPDATLPDPIEVTAPSEQPTPTEQAAPLDGQTDTEWGRIWDRVPAGFPSYPQAILADELASGPASATYAGPGTDPADVAAWYQNALETAAFSTEALSGPLEDGSCVIESIGQDPDCRIEVSMTPLGETIAITVLYGADCLID